MNLLLFLIVLSVLIVVHEFGHFLMAKKLGVRVEKFSLGFGKKLYSRVHDGTEFMICAIPLGGYVKMAGDERSQCQGDPGEYFSKPPGHRALIVLMGPVVNFVLAYFCFSFVYMIGYADINSISKNVPAVVGLMQDGYPAKNSGLQIGDRIVKIDDTEIGNWDDLQEYVYNSDGEDLNFLVERDQQLVNIKIIPREDVHKDFLFGRKQKIRRVGIAPPKIDEPQDVPIIKYGFWQSWVEGGKELSRVTALTYQALFEMLIGVRSAKEAMGIVGMFYVIKFAISVSFSLFLHLFAVISASLAIFNLLPLIPLDGGHLFLIFIEKIRGRALPVKIEDAIAKVGLTLILCLALFVFYADFERVGWIDKIVELWSKK